MFTVLYLVEHHKAYAKAAVFYQSPCFLVLLRSE